MPQASDEQLVERLHDRALYMADCGFSFAFIGSKTGLSKGQITYLFGKKGKKVSMYRNGGGIMAQRVLLKLPKL